MKNHIRKIDNAGRFRIPKEIQDTYGWVPGTFLEMINTKEGLLLKNTSYSDKEKKKAVKYLEMQLEDATNEDDRSAILIALCSLNKISNL